MNVRQILWTAMFSIAIGTSTQAEETPKVEETVITSPTTPAPQEQAQRGERTGERAGNRQKGERSGKRNDERAGRRGERRDGSGRRSGGRRTQL